MRTNSLLRTLAVFGFCTGLPVLLLALTPTVVSGVVCVPDAPGECAGAVFSSATEGIALEAGQFLPLIIGWVNNTHVSDITMTVTMKANLFFPQDQVVGTSHLPAGFEEHLGSAVGVQTTPDTPTGTALITLQQVIAAPDGSAFGNQVKFWLTILPPGGLDGLITVPVRWCAVEGSDQAEGKKAGEFVRGANLLALLQQQNAAVWVPKALIEFHSAYAPKGIPVISGTDDPLLQRPDPRCTYPQLGDLQLASLLSDARPAAAACEAAWAANYPNQKGTTAINYRLTVARGGAGVPLVSFPSQLGNSFPPDRALMVGGTHGH